MKKAFNNVTLALLTLLPAATLAASTDVEIKDPNVTTVAGILTKILEFVVPLVGGVTVLFIIYAGIMYVTSSGNKDRADKAKQTLTYAVIGLIIVVLAYVIVEVVKNLPTNVGLTKP